MVEDYNYEETLRSLEITNKKVKKEDIELITENELLEEEEGYEEQESS